MAWHSKDHRTAEPVGAPPEKTAPHEATKAKDSPDWIPVLERRMKYPFGEPSSRIALKEVTMVVKIFNRQVGPQRIYNAKRAGWVPVQPNELADAEQAGGFRVGQEGYLVRGEREEEVLMKAPREFLEAIKRAKTEANWRNLRPGAMREEVAQAAATQFGSEAGDFIGKETRIVGDVHDSYERVQRLEED